MRNIALVLLLLGCSGCVTLASAAKETGEIISMSIDPENALLKPRATMLL